MLYETNEEKTLLQGFGVDIDELLKCIQNSAL